MKLPALVFPMLTSSPAAVLSQTYSIYIFLSKKNSCVVSKYVAEDLSYFPQDSDLPASLRTPMSSRSAREYETSDQSLGRSASPPVPESSETEGLIFYHMDLYGSKERFDIFPEELSGQGDRPPEDTRRESALSSKKSQPSQEAGYDLEKEVAELAKMYGIDEDREKELELLGGHMEMVKNRWPPARTEKAGSQGSVYNASKSSSSEKDQSQSTKQQGLPGKASQDEDQSKARAEDEAESPIWSREGLSSGSTSDEWNSQAASEEEEAADVFCSTCKIPIRAFDKLFGEHKDHEVAQFPGAMESEKVRVI